MTASLPMSRDVDPDEPDERHASAQVVSLPTAGEGRAPLALHGKRPSKSTRDQAAKRGAGSAAAIPPPPPVPADLAAAGIVVPPKPPLPAPQEPTETAAPTGTVEPTETVEPTGTAEPAEPLPPAEATESENAIHTEAPATLPTSAGPFTEPEALTEPGPLTEPETPTEPETLTEPEALTEPDAPTEHEAPAARAPAILGAAVVAEAAAPPKTPEVTPATPAPPALPAEVPAVVAAVEPAPVPEPHVLEHVPEVLSPPVARGDALVIRGITKSFGDARAVEGIDLTVPAGTFYGLVGPNGAGKTTTLSMIAGLLKPDRGSITVAGVDANAHPLAAKRLMGVLPDRLQIFDRLTGRQLLYYYGVLRGLSPAVVERRTADLARAFDLTDALGRAVSDYSAGMVKKVMLAGALIHSPRLLVLDEPFEAVDPVSSAIILDILSTYVTHGGTVILSSHGMDLVERVCSRVAVLVAGQVLAEGTIEEVRGELTLEQRFIELAGGLSDVEGLEWLHTFSD